MDERALRSQTCKAMQAASTPSPILHELSVFASALVPGACSPQVLHHARRAVLDWLAALYPATRCAPALNLLQASADELGHGRSSVVGCGTTAFAPTAAWLNGCASHAVEFDDIYREAVYHPGSPIVAAALAVAESIDASGEAFLSAIVAGYELSTRVGAALQPSHNRFFHATGTIGCLGAAAAAAVLLRPGDAVAMRHAVATAATFASGLQQALRSETMTKPLHAGHAAAAGVRAAQAAACGVTGAADILDGPLGLGAAMADAPSWERATEGLGRQWHITRITHKVHACCGHVFPSIDAALALRAEHGIRIEDVEAIQVSTSAQAIEATGRFDPRTAYEAKFSLPYVVCHALAHGSVGLDAFEPERVNDRHIRALMRLLSITEDPEATAGFPTRRTAGMVIALKDGRQFTHFAPHRRGDPESPLSDAELDAKFDRLAGPVVGPARAPALRVLVWRLGEIGPRALGLAKPLN